MKEFQEPYRTYACTFINNRYMSIPRQRNVRPAIGVAIGTIDSEKFAIISFVNWELLLGYENYL